MPPKQKPTHSDTAVDRETASEASRLRMRASPSLLQAHAPPDTAQIPVSLRKSDGADIIKRNASRKKRYLFVFPGALSLPVAGGNVGSLTSLDTRNPILDIKFPVGTLRLFGTLVFPQNAFISVKPAKRAVQIMDVFETMVIFSEWRWVGDLTSNPGGVPVLLPDTLKGHEEDLWQSASIVPNPSGEGSNTMHTSSEEDSPAFVNSDEDGWAAAKTEPTAPSRSNPRRRGRVINYSQLENDEDDDDSGDKSDDDSTNKKRGVRQLTLGNGPKDVDDSLQIIEDVQVEEVKPGRGSRWKRRKVDYTAESSGEEEQDGYLGGPKKGESAIIQDNAKILQLDDNSVELVETVKAEPEFRTQRASRRVVRKVKYSRESGDEDVIDYEDDGDKDFAVDDVGDGLEA